MEIKVLKEDKNMIEVEIDSITIVELLRIYCNKEGAKIAAWKRDHPTKNPILHVEGDNPGKIIQKAISAVQKELESYSEEFKKMK